MRPFSFSEKASSAMLLPLITASYAPRKCFDMLCIHFHSKYFLLSLYIYSLTDGIFVSYGYLDKLPHTAWLKTITKNFFLTVLEARSSKFMCWWGHTSAKGSREDSMPCLFQLLVALCVVWCVATSLQCLP